MPIKFLEVFVLDGLLYLPKQQQNKIYTKNVREKLLF